ncbi:hypothetical protein [Hyalangium versicolor]|uniref:hypothetical protein n=1 Tax=Hyalangium versicolor TaxID=2861190 RepID=UPI001CCC14A4|nr:hypothetical protein [Hyalangium versicolor]
MKKLLVLVVLLAAGAGAAYHFGYLQRLMPGALAPRLIPKDAKLLAYFRPDAQELLVVQMTEVDFPLPEETRQKLAQNGREFYDKTGIDVRKDVDAVAVADRLAIARGRFDWSRLGAYLQTEGYTLTELDGVPAAVKSQSTSMALDGKYLLMGRRAEIKRALERKRQGQGLEDGSPIVKAIDELGWKHALVGGVASGSRLSSDEDLRMQSAVGAVDSAPDGMEVRAVALTGSKEQGEALHATLEMLRKAAVLQLSVLPKTELRALKDSLDRATLEVDPQGRVRGTIRVPYALLDQTSANVSQQQLPSTLASLQLTDDGTDSEPIASANAPPPSSTQAPSTAAPTVTVTHHLDWKPPVFGLILLVIALVTMGAQARPGLFNVLFHPLFLLPFLVATLGVFVFRWTGHSGGVFDLLQLPMPEWHRFLSVPLAQPVALSVAIPMLIALLSGPVSLLRRFAAGLAVGFSGYLVTKALSGDSVALIPPAYTLYWYAGNALAALLLARLTIPPRISGKKKK